MFTLILILCALFIVASLTDCLCELVVALGFAIRIAIPIVLIVVVVHFVRRYW